MCILNPPQLNTWWWFNGYINPLLGTLKPQSNGSLYRNMVIGTLAGAPPRPLLAVPNVTAHPSTASGPTSYYSMCHYKYLWTLKDQTKRSLLRKEAGRLLFDFGVAVVNGTDDDCQQQTPTVAVCLWQLKTPAMWRRSILVNNCCGLTRRQVTQEVMLIFELNFFYFKLEYLSKFSKYF